MTIGDPPATKDDARRRARVVRDALAADGRHHAAARTVCDRVAAQVPLPDGVVAGYWPLGSELDVRPLLARLAGLGRTAALPVSGPKGQPLRFHIWTPDAPMRCGRYGIQEPADGAPAVVPDAVLVPLLAFDRAGHRLGYGAGYYDRTLAELRAGGRPVLAVGVAFAAQEIAAVPRDAYDQPLDWVVTEHGAFRFS